MEIIDKEQYRSVKLVSKDFPCGASGKEPACQCRRHEMQIQSLGQEDPPVGGHGNPLLYSCVENPMDRRAWWATVHGVTKQLDTTEETKHNSFLDDFFLRDRDLI